MVDEHTPWTYLIYQKFPNRMLGAFPSFCILTSRAVAPEEQIVLLFSGINKGFLSQSAFLNLAISPPVQPLSQSSEISSWIELQIQLGFVIQNLRDCVDFPITSIFAAMSFNPVLPTLLSTDARLAAENAKFKRLDDAAFAEVQHEWATWADHDLPVYYLAFVTAQTQLAHAGVHTCWMQTVAFLGARRGGPACWNLKNVAAQDFEFLLPYSVAGLSQSLH